MNFDRFDLAYWKKQKDRVEEIRSRIVGRSALISPGRVIPSDSELAQGLGRRLDLSVLFIDLVESTQRPATTLAEQEWILRIYDLFFTEAIRVSEEYGGEVEKNTGDGLMVYFADSWIGSNEPSQKRALGSVMTLKYVTRHLLNPIIEASSQTPLRFRAGMDHGPVTIAQIGAARRFGNRVALGTTANIASKMLAGASEEILIGENVYNAIPENWKAHCSLYMEQTGFIKIATGEPYKYYKFSGEWVDPI